MIDRIRDTYYRLNRSFVEYKIKAKVVNHTESSSYVTYHIKTRDRTRLELKLKDIQLYIKTDKVMLKHIPNTDLLGLSVPKLKRDIIKLKDVLKEANLKKLDFIIGMDIYDNLLIGNIKKLHNMLIAGGTGGGKSTFIETIISSLIYTNKPDSLKFVIIDPKHELKIYNELPHMYSDVASEDIDIERILEILVKEMNRRFIQDDYKMPIIVFIDEYADLSKNAKDNVYKLIRKCRGANIHIIIATQHPRYDVIDTRIKSCLLTKACFKVALANMSMTILDVPGAEKLLGTGDMIFSHNGIYTLCQVAYITKREIEKTIDYFKQIRKAPIIESKHIDNLDQLFIDIAAYYILNGNCSVNDIKKRFNVAHIRARKIMDQLIDEKIIIETTNKFNDVVMSVRDFKEKYGDLICS